MYNLIIFCFFSMICTILSISFFSSLVYFFGNDCMYFDDDNDDILLYTSN